MSEIGIRLLEMPGQCPPKSGCLAIPFFRTYLHGTFAQHLIKKQMGFWVHSGYIPGCLVTDTRYMEPGTW
jgi:hypothetical protein